MQGERDEVDSCALVIVFGWREAGYGLVGDDIGDAIRAQHLSAERSQSIATLCEAIFDPGQMGLYGRFHGPICPYDYAEKRRNQHRRPARRARGHSQSPRRICALNHILPPFIACIRAASSSANAYTLSNARMRWSTSREKASRDFVVVNRRLACKSGSGEELITWVSRLRLTGFRV